MRLDELISKLKGLRSYLDNWLENPINSYFDPRDTKDLFTRFSAIRIELISLWPKLFNDFPHRGIPVPSKTTDYDGRGYIKRGHFELLLNDINYCLKVLSESNLKKQKTNVDSVGAMKESDVGWAEIGKEFGITKREFGKKVNFITGAFKRNAVFRDIEHAYALLKIGFYKPSVILAGGVIEELLKLYLQYKKIKPTKNKFDEYIKACENHGLLKTEISGLTTVNRKFRNIVHLENEPTAKHSITKPIATMAIASIFTIANDF